MWLNEQYSWVLLKNQSFTHTCTRVHAHAHTHTPLETNLLNHETIIVYKISYCRSCYGFFKWNWRPLSYSLLIMQSCKNYSFKVISFFYNYIKVGGFSFQSSHFTHKRSFQRKNTLLEPGFSKFVSWTSL